MMETNIIPKLIILSGSPWVGKTTVAEALFESCENSAYCDGDWLWHVNPFSLRDPRLRNGDRNISFVLSNYLSSQFEYVIFSSVVLTDELIRESILNGITAEDYTRIGITLTCSEETLRERHKARGDDSWCEVNYYWLRLPSYPGDHIIDTDNKSVLQIVDEIRSIIGERE